MSFETKSKILNLNENKTINLIVVSNLNLYIISDLQNFGSNWIQVLFDKLYNTYTTKTLFGAEEDTMAPICRLFAESVIKNNPLISQSSEVNEQIVLTFNISLKYIDISDSNVIKQIAQHL